MEKTISDTLFYFKDSAVRRDKFHILLELTDLDHEYLTIINYHKVQWLYLSECVNRLCAGAIF